MVYQETKPRGPVAAAYNSPGPVYQLPGSIGYVDHDPRSTMERRPAYAFGVHHGKLRDDAGPGPKYYPDPKYSRHGPECNYKYSLYGRPKELKSWAKSTPGPGAYSPEVNSTVSPSSPRYSFGYKTNLRGSDANPGPNVYNVPSTLGKTVLSNMKQAPMISQVGRSQKGGFHEDLGQTPGPGAYKVTSPDLYKRRGPGYSIIGRSKVVGDNTQKPGPGAHKPENVKFDKRSAPSYSFGTRHSQFEAPLFVEVDD